MPFVLVFFLRSYTLEQLEIKSEKNNWDLETYRNKLEKLFLFLDYVKVVFPSDPLVKTR